MASKEIAMFTESPVYYDPTQIMPVDQSRTFFGGQHHPWRRFFARIIDISLVTIFLVIAFLLISNLNPFGFANFVVRVIDYPSLILGGTLVLMLMLEACCLTWCATTPSKWLFGMRIVHSDGGRLSFWSAFRRSCWVFVEGMGCGIPLVSFFTQLFAYWRLSKTGRTSWDRGGQVLVLHREWSVWRAICCTMAVCTVTAGISYINGSPGQ